MTTDDCTKDFAATSGFITDLFCRIDDAMTNAPKHSQAKFFPSEVVTLGLLFVLNGQDKRAFFRWAQGNLTGFFPRLSGRTRLFRLLSHHRNWTHRFLSKSTLYPAPTLVTFPVGAGSHRPSVARTPRMLAEGPYDLH